MEFEKGNKVAVKNTGDVWEGKQGTVVRVEDDTVLVKINFEVDDEIKTVIQEFNKENLEMERENESLNEQKEELTESVNLNEAKEKKEDIIHKYIYLEDLDEKEIPAWNFAARIATAEDVSEECICNLAKEFGYKIFVVEASQFHKCVIASKEINAEDIKEEYADFLLGKSCVYELK